MKYRILERPSCEEGYDLVEEALRKKTTIIIFACCKVNYEGRALSQLNWGERIILIKPDGSFLIHQERKVDPVNWQPPKSRTRSFIRNDKLILESHRRVPKELLSVEIRKIFIFYYIVNNNEKLFLAEPLLLGLEIVLVYFQPKVHDYLYLAFFLLIPFLIFLCR